MAIVDLIVLVLLGLVAFLIVQSRRSVANRENLPPVDPETAQLRDEMLELRARIQVLERVITDNHGAADLTREIDRLRDRTKEADHDR